MNNDLIEPIKFYKEYLKDKFYNQTIEYFDKLVKDNKIDEQANKETIKEYKKELEEIDRLNKIIRKLKNIKILLIVCIVIYIIGIFYGISCISGGYSNIGLLIFLIILCLGLMILFIFLLKKQNNKINDQQSIKDKHVKKSEDLKQEGYDQLRELNNNYDFGIANTLINNLDTIIKMDKLLDPYKLSFLIDRYGFNENSGKDSSTLLVQSGSILGNPFIIKKDLNTFMGSQTYYGSITIYWTTTSTDSNGNSRTEHHSQVLTASVTKPCPRYYQSTSLIYGNEAAPNLKFHRDKNEVSSYEDNKLERYLKSFDRKLDKMVRKDMKSNDGSMFTRLQNTKFEALFNGLDRDNEVEFRLLFTPLSQKNMIDLLQDKDSIGYGDDFSFYKNKKINKIVSDHSQSFNYSSNPTLFVDFDLERAKNKFIVYNNQYLKSFFFDLAPLLSIPLYQQTKTKEYIYNNDYPSNITSFEHEVLANSFNTSLLEPSDCATQIINKTNIYSKEKDCDKVEIESYGYKIKKRVDYISRLGGDGYYHDVPVEWDEYIPISTTNYMQAHSNIINRNNYNKVIDENDDIICIDGIISYLTDEYYDEDKMNLINSKLNKIKKGE